VCVATLKNLILDHTGVPVARQRLFCSGIELVEDNQNLSEYEIRNESTLRLVVRSEDLFTSPTPPSPTPSLSPTPTPPSPTLASLELLGPDSPSAASEEEELPVGTNISSAEHPVTLFRVCELRPNRGPMRGGQRVRIVGEHFPDFSTYACKFGGLSVIASFVSSNELRVSAPPAWVPGDVAVEVSCDGARFTNDGVIYTYLGSQSMENTAISIPVFETCGSRVALRNESCRPLEAIPVFRHDPNNL